MRSVKGVFFSPTGTTKAVVQSIASGFASKDVELVDITSPEARKQPMVVSKDELIIIGVPVYMGRVPALLSDWLGSIKADNTPVVCVVVYGNRVYDDALLELQDMVVERGCIPVAGAAYIGEHSFSSEDAQVAHGRPDKNDLQHATDFGRQVWEKLQSVDSVAQLLPYQVPGVRPYGGTVELWDVDFIEVGDRCNQCGLCANVCPMGAVDAQDSRLIDGVKCITCCACIKRCPQNAKSMKSGPVKDAQKRLNTLFKDPRPPECYL